MEKQSTSLHLNDFKLIAFDMDSTLINIECIDELAAVAGQKDAVAAITEAAMRGEIRDFRDSLSRRLALLKGLPATALEEVYQTKLRLNPGAQALVAACKKAGLRSMLVSGGFTYFAKRVQQQLGLDYAYANELEIEDGKLTGKVLTQDFGDIVDGETKQRLLLATCAQLGLQASQCIAVGDGANDIPMMQVAGLSVAYHAKPVVQAAARIAINDAGLDALLSYFS